MYIDKKGQPKDIKRLLAQEMTGDLFDLSANIDTELPEAQDAICECDKAGRWLWQC